MTKDTLWHKQTNTITAFNGQSKKITIAIFCDLIKLSLFVVALFILFHAK